MDRNGHPDVQVVINGHNQIHRPHGTNMHFQNQPRSLSVDEALQYSSMSSAPVFGLGLFIRLLFESSQFTDDLYTQIASYVPMLADPRTRPP
jgi:hypothetical protein